MQDYCYVWNRQGSLIIRLNQEDLLKKYVASLPRHLFNTRIVTVQRQCIFVEIFHVNNLQCWKFFIYLIFVGQGYPQKLFNLEHFPIYGMSQASTGLLQRPSKTSRQNSTSFEIQLVLLYAINIIMIMGSGFLYFTLYIFTFYTYTTSIQTFTTTQSLQQQINSQPNGCCGFDEFDRQTTRQMFNIRG